jgi:hypothetical protein
MNGQIINIKSKPKMLKINEAKYFVDGIVEKNIINYWNYYYQSIQWKLNAIYE